MKKTLVELFAGVGGFRCGLNHVELKDGKTIENGNWKCLWANQWEPATKSQEAYDCYAMRFGAEDVSNVELERIRALSEAAKEEGSEMVSRYEEEFSIMFKKDCKSLGYKRKN